MAEKRRQILLWVAEKNTKNSAKKSHEISASTVLRLSKFETNMVSIAESLAVTGEQMTELQNDVVGVEDLISQNTQIINSLKILTVNAAIQASKAGTNGAGFGALAKELKQLLLISENHHKKSSTILKNVKQKGLDGAQSIQKNNENINYSFSILNSCKDSIKETSQKTLDTSTKLTKTSRNIQEQLTAISQIAIAISLIDSSTANVSKLTASLIEDAEKLERANLAFEEVINENLFD